MTEDEYSEKHLRMRCLEIARPLFPTTADIDALLRTAEKLWGFVNAAGDKDASGSPSGSSDVNPAVAPAFKVTPEQLARLDAAELERQKES